MNVLAMRLVTGEDLVGRCVVSLEKKTTSIEKPFLIHVQPDQSGQVKLGLIPYPVFGNEGGTLVIDHQHIVYDYHPSPSIERTYTEQTSGIVHASSLEGIPRIGPNGLEKS